jgi:Subtilase family/Lectin C-type domain
MKATSITTRLLRCLRFPSLGLALALGLSACGGGDGAGLGGGDGVKRAALAAVEADQAKVMAVNQISEKRISRTVFEYVFSVTVLNGASPQTDVLATVASVGTGTTVIDGVAVVGNMAANAQVTSADTITLRHDRTYQFDLTKLIWRVSGTVPLTAQPITVRGVVPERLVALSTGEQVVMSDLLVVLDESVSAITAATLFAQMGGTIVGRVPEAHLYQVEIPEANTEAKLRAVRDVLVSRSEVLDVSFNSMAQTSATSVIAPSTVYYPNDQYVRRENNSFWKILASYQRPALDAVNAGTAWKALQTIPLSPVVVGVIDGGFTNDNKSELEFAKLSGPTADNLSFEPVADGKNSIDHGMHVGGIIAAKGETGVTSGGNVAGLAWQVPVELHGARTDFSFVVQLAHVAKLVRAKAKVINASIGYTGRRSLDVVCSEAGASSRVISRLAKYYGEFVYVLAAGNEYDTAYFHQPLALLFQPQEALSCPLFVGAKAMSSTDLGVVKSHIIIVANADTTIPGKEELFRGTTGSNFGLGVEIAAPGVQILSLGFASDYWKKPLSLTGTSMAAPQVSAALAVAWSIAPNISAAQAKQIVVGNGSASPASRLMVSDPQGRQYPLLDLNDVVNQAVAAAGQPKPPTDPAAIAPLVIYSTCKYNEGVAFSRTTELTLNLRITTGLGSLVQDEGLLVHSYDTSLPAGAYVLMLQEPTGLDFIWNSQRPTKSFPFTLADNPRGNVRTIHVQFKAATRAACESIDPLTAETATGQSVSIPSAAINLPATAFIRGTNVALSTNGFGVDTLENAPPYGEAANAAEWDFNVPVAGTYELFAEYAAAESRPVNIAFNGTVKFTNALAATTGGWFPANRQTLSQGVVALQAGATTMRVSRASVFPHIRGFKLVPVSPVTLTNPANGHRYEVITCGTWTQCDAAARAKGGNLVTIRSEAENAWIVSNLLPSALTTAGLWIGFTDRVTEGIWKWQSGEVSSYVNWWGGGPDNYLGIEHYAHISNLPLNRGYWNDLPDAYTASDGALAQAIVEYSLSGTFLVPAKSPAGTLFTAPAGATSCAFNASGSWSYGLPSSADGVPSFDSPTYPRLLPSTPYFSLIANTANGYIAIGSNRTVSVSSGQAMQFQINEGIGIGDSYADNSGALSVTYQCQ